MEGSYNSLPVFMERGLHTTGTHLRAFFLFCSRSYFQSFAFISETDSRCDRMGNFVFSTMDAGEPVQTIGRFHRFNAATLKTETLDLPEVAIPNSICFSPDGSTMYYADSLQGCIFCCNYPSLENQRVFTRVKGQGTPDGS